MEYVYEAHGPIKVKYMPWLRCRWCGLVYLRNEFSSWSIKKGCNSSEHPDYRKWLGRR